MGIYYCYKVDPENLTNVVETDESIFDVRNSWGPNILRASKIMDAFKFVPSVNNIYGYKFNTSSYLEIFAIILPNVIFI